VARDSADKKWSENDCTNKEKWEKLWCNLLFYFFPSIQTVGTISTISTIH